MTMLMLGALVGMTGIWFIILAAVGVRTRLFLARHPFVFLCIHLPVMFALTSVGGEGLTFGVANLIAGIIAQLWLMSWGVRKHGLTWTGKRTERYYRLHPRKRGVSIVKALRYRALHRLAYGSGQERSGR